MGKIMISWDPEQVWLLHFQKLPHSYFLKHPFIDWTQRNDKHEGGMRVEYLSRDTKLGPRFRNQGNHCTMEACG